MNEIILAYILIFGLAACVLLTEIVKDFIMDLHDSGVFSNKTKRGK